MLTRTALALLLLLSPAASAQDLDTALSALVRISGTRSETLVRGSGFVVALDRGKATILTASHVIEGVQQLELAFAADLTRTFPVGTVLGLDAGNPRGLAAVQVLGAPAGVTPLSFEIERRPRLGEALFLLGFPQMELAPRTARRTLSSLRETILLIDQGIGEGFSGGPVLQGDLVVGMVTETDDQTTYAVNALVAYRTLEGWGVKLACVPGEERTENGIVFVRICPGKFMMGSKGSDRQADDHEQPAHEVKLGEFWIGKTEVTNEQYRNFRSGRQGEARLPVTNVSWFDAKAACESFGGRLPTEAEWEYAARAGSSAAWSSGHDEKLLGDYAWYKKNSEGKPHPAGTRKPNAWSLHDMHGNVWEWVADWHGPYSGTAQINPAGPDAGRERMIRGGAFDAPSGSLRSAGRVPNPPEYKNEAIGFRCVHGAHRQP